MTHQTLRVVAGVGRKKDWDDVCRQQLLQEIQVCVLDVPVKNGGCVCVGRGDCEDGGHMWSVCNGACLCVCMCVYVCVCGGCVHMLTNPSMKR